MTTPFDRLPSPVPTADISGTPWAYDERNRLAQWLLPAPTQMATYDNALWRQRAGMPDESDEAWAHAEGSPWKRTAGQNALMTAAGQLNTPTGTVLGNFMGPAIGRIPRPVRAYHGGTTKDWRTGLPYTELNSSNGPWSGFFSDKRDVSNKFASGYTHDNGVFPVDLHLKNPFVIDAKGRPAREMQFSDRKMNWPKPGEDTNAAWIDADGFSKRWNWSPEFRRAVMSPDHDAVVIRNTADEGDIYIPTKRGTVQSATSGDWLYSGALPAVAAGGAAFVQGATNDDPMAAASAGRVPRGGGAKGIRGYHGSPHNFAAERLVFDETLIDILRKYGLAGLMTGGGAFVQGAASDGQATASAGRMPRGGVIPTAERPAQAALRVGDRTYTGAHHGEALMRAIDDLGEARFNALYAAAGPDAYQMAEGFVTTTGRYVTRPEAERLLVDAGAIDPARATGTMETTRLDRLNRIRD